MRLVNYDDCWGEDPIWDFCCKKIQLTTDLKQPRTLNIVSEVNVNKGKRTF